MDVIGAMCGLPHAMAQLCHTVRHGVALTCVCWIWRCANQRLSFLSNALAGLITLAGAKYYSDFAGANLSCPSALLKFLDIFMYVWLAVGAHLKEELVTMSWTRQLLLWSLCWYDAAWNTSTREMFGNCYEFATLSHNCIQSFHCWTLECKVKNNDCEQSRTFLELVYWIFELAKSPQVYEIIRFLQQCVSFELGHLIFELAEVL